MAYPQLDLSFGGLLSGQPDDDALARLLRQQMSPGMPDFSGVQAGASTDFSGVQAGRGSTAALPLTLAQQPTQQRALPKATGAVTTTAKTAPAPQTAPDQQTPAPTQAPTSDVYGQLQRSYDEADALRNSAYDKLTPSDADLESYRRSGTYGQLAGIAMQMLGNEAQQNIGGTLLTKSIAELEKGKRDPWKVGEMEAKKLDAKAAALEKRAQFAVTVEEKRDALRLADQTRKEALQLRADMARQSDETRRFVAGAMAGDRSGRLSDARAAQVDRVGGQVMDDYIKSIKDDRILLNAFGNLKATAQKTDAASDISFVFQYMKMLDPNSVVREGEFATAQNAAGIPDRIRNLYNKVREGVILNPKQRADFLSTAERLAAESESRIQQRQREFVPRLQAVGADPTIYLPGYRAPANAPPGSVRNPAGVANFPGGGAGEVDFNQLPRTR